jgi:hypothetical protein
MTHRTLTIVLVTALALIAVQVAWSAIPGSNGTIVGCYKKTGGALRVVNAKADCDTATEKPLTWKQGPSRINVDMAMSRTDHGTTTAFSGNGLTITTTCFIEFVSGGSEGGQMHVDAGSSGDINATYTFSDFFNPTTVKQDGFLPGNPATQLDIGYITGTPSGSTPYRLEGTLVAHTTTNVVSVVFHILINFTSERCQYFGTVTPA